MGKLRFGIRHFQIFFSESSHRCCVLNYRSAVGNVQLQSADSYSFHDRRFLVSSLSKRPYKVFQSFRECFYFQKSREISVPATSQVTHFFRNLSMHTEEKRFGMHACSVFTIFFDIYPRLSPPGAFFASVRSASRDRWTERIPDQGWRSLIDT